MINQKSLDLIKEFEGFRADAYKDAAGIWTIGYGTTARAGVGIEPKPGMKITKAEAEEYLLRAVTRFAAQIDKMITQPINENEFGAFVSLAYNIGPLAFSKSSALRNFNAGNKVAAANAMLAWNKATVNGRKKVLRGLQRRREAEKALFLSPVAPTTQTLPTGRTAPRAAAPVSIAVGLAAAAWAIWEGIKAIFGG